MDKSFEEKIEKIYGLLSDDISRTIFENRLLYSLTGDYSFNKKVVCTIEEINHIHEYLKSCNHKVAIFGAGNLGKKIYHIFKDVKFECFIDNNPRDEKLNDLPVISLEQCKKKYGTDIDILILSKWFHEEIYQQLLETGYKEENIFNLSLIYEKVRRLQYFDLPEFANNIAEREVFLDGGCYDGDSSMEFIKWHEKYASKKDYHIFAWEPNFDNELVIREKLKDTNYTLVKKGLWSHKDTLRFIQDELSSRIATSEEKAFEDIGIEVDSIDNIMKVPPTFIKMDIEGSEYEALVGAKEIIKNYKPKLAICVYHKKEDIWELPWLIYSMNSEYRFYLRHYSLGHNDTVLYAL